MSSELLPNLRLPRRIKRSISMNVLITKNALYLLQTEIYTGQHEKYASVASSRYQEEWWSQR